MRNKQAYTLIETLLVVLMLPILYSLSFSIFKILYKYDYDLTSRQNFIGILQLRKKVALGSDLELKGDSLIMTLNNQSIELYCQSDRLNQIDGYMEYLIDIQECSWKKEAKRLYITYTFREQFYEIFIGFID